jgi:hypothetical protein
LGERAAPRRAPRRRAHRVRLLGRGVTRCPARLW